MNKKYRTQLRYDMLCDNESVYRARQKGLLVRESHRTYDLIDLFAGAGGLTLGFTETLGNVFAPVWANDFNVMGFPDELPIVVSDTQAYRQFGNALVPQIASEVAKRVVAVFRWHMETRGLSQFRAVAPTNGTPDRKQEVPYAVAAG